MQASCGTMCAMFVPGRATQLTYCTNIHAGESWAEVDAALQLQVREVKQRVSPEAPFGVGLRLSARACQELEADASRLGALRAELAELGLYVFTLNGFPYGAFHGTRVKEAVYRPDWLEPERVRYTASLARVLASLLPSGMVGSISTVPGCFAPRGASAQPRRLLVTNLCAAVAELVRLERAGGSRVQLALEPEPACVLETTAETIAFFQDELFQSQTLEGLARELRVQPSEAELLLRRHLGVCVDACHAAVEFESPLGVVRRLRAAGIDVPKIQISAGLRVPSPSPESLAALELFADDTYLHQVVVRTPPAGKLVRFLDLADALAAANELPTDAEWRVHFHVPVFEASLGSFSSTQDQLDELLTAPDVAELTSHWEVETYTFDVLPEQYRNLPVTQAIARELEWVLARLGQSAGLQGR